MARCRRAAAVGRMSTRPQRAVVAAKPSMYAEAAPDKGGSTFNNCGGQGSDAESTSSPLEPPSKRTRQSNSGPSRSKGSRKPANAKESIVREDEDGDHGQEYIVEPGGAQAGAESDLTPLEDDAASDWEPITKKARGQGKARKADEKVEALDTGGEANVEDKRTKERPLRKKREPKSEPVYVIPDVQTLPTTFRGRLGYACLNTILRNKKPAREAVFCSRTCRIDTLLKSPLGRQHAQELGLQNTRDLLKIIEWNEENHIRFMRVSSEMFPFASHKVWGYSLEYAKQELAKVGEAARIWGHRLTTHPGQFTQLGSPRKEVVDNSFRDLAYHCEILDLMGVGPDGVMILHGGGTYNDKPAALARIRTNITRLPAKVRARLVLENDEICFNAEDLLPLCEELDVPLVFDYHHDCIYPSSIPPKEIIRRANAIFEKRGIRPKQHLSSPRPGAVTVMERRAHANRCEALPPDLPDDIDLMIEAKDKEQAVMHLYRIYQLAPVIHANLRPPDQNEGLHTKGRKSHSPKKTQGDDEGTVIIAPGGSLADPNRGGVDMVEEGPGIDDYKKALHKRERKRANKTATGKAEESVPETKQTLTTSPKRRGRPGKGARPLPPAAGADGKLQPKVRGLRVRHGQSST